MRRDGGGDDEQQTSVVVVVVVLVVVAGIGRGGRQCRGLLLLRTKLVVRIALCI